MRLLVVDINDLSMNLKICDQHPSEQRVRTKAIYTPCLLINTKPESICPQSELDKIEIQRD